MKVVVVDWWDSCVKTDSGWEIPHEPLEPLRCRTVGFVFEDNKKYITLFSTGNEEGTRILGRITIPAQAVIKKRILLKD